MITGPHFFRSLIVSPTVREEPENCVSNFCEPGNLLESITDSNPYFLDSIGAKFLSSVPFATMSLETLLTGTCFNMVVII